MLIDSHCHLPSLKNSEKLEKTVNEACAEGVEFIINVGTSLRLSKEAIKVASLYTNVFATIAVYPHEDRDVLFTNIQSSLADLACQPKVVAIGETGLDVSDWKKGRSVDDQLRLFELHIKLALDHNLPLIIHNRNADDLVLETLAKYKTAKLRGVLHCFSSSWEIAQRFMDLNFLLSFAGMITYPSRKPLLEVVNQVPMDMFLVETDSPYLPPQGHRGEENQPKYVKIVAEKIAQVKQKSFEDIAEVTSSNTRKLFNI